MNPSNDPTQPKPAVNQPQPAAYDQHGRPLYAHPPQQQPGVPPQSPVAPQVVYVARPHEPQAPHLSEEAKARHEESVRQHPHLNLSEGEYIVATIKRHPIGLVMIWGSTVILVLLICFILPALLLAQGALGAMGVNADFDASLMGLLLILGLSALFLLGGFIAAHVYNSNRFYLTNESVIQHIQHSLFSKREQTISLSSIEDASFNQTGLLEHFFNYGTLRLSTEGEETTYRFAYANDPRKQVAVLNDAVESFKNGRPVDPHED